MSSRGTFGKKVVATLFAVALVGLPAVTRARAPDAPRDPGAEKLLADGLERFDAGDFVGATRAWEALVRDRGEAESFRVLYNLGLAYRNAGQLDRAVDCFERFLRRVGNEASALDAPLEERRQDAAEQVALLLPKVATISVRRAVAAHEVKVTIDDRVPRDAGFDTYVMPGRHAITIGDGPSARRVTVDVAAGETHAIDASIQVPAVPRSTPPVVDPSPEKPRTQSNAGPIAFGVLAGATALSFALPIGLGVHAGNVADAAQALGRGHTRYDDAIASY